MDCNDWKCCCAGVSEMLCLRSTYCLAVDAPPRSVGCGHGDALQGECCKCGVYCLDCAVIKPRMLCGGAKQSLCMKEAGAFPLHKDYLDKPVCAYYFLSCLPKCGCCTEPPESPALKVILEGGEDAYLMASTAPALAGIDRFDDGEEFGI